MFHRFLLVAFYGCLGLELQAQIEDYYRPQKRGGQPYLSAHRDLYYIKNHWYVGIEGGGKWNGSMLSNDLSGFLRNQKSLTDSYAGGHIGYNHNLRWSVETGYIHNPSNIFLWINAPRPFSYLINDLQHTLPFRFKWRILKVGTVQKKSGIYVGGGFLWTPSRMKQQINRFELSGLSRISRTQVDTVLVENKSFVTGQAKLEWEGSVEFVGRVAQHFEIVCFGRVSYSSSSALRSDSKLFVNQVLQNTSAATLHPANYYFGVSLRYLYGLKNLYQSRFEE